MIQSTWTQNTDFWYRFITYHHPYLFTVIDILAIYCYWHPQEATPESKDETAYTGSDSDSVTYDEVDPDEGYYKVPRNIVSYTDCGPQFKFDLM